MKLKKQYLLTLLITIFLSNQLYSKTEENNKNKTKNINTTQKSSEKKIEKKYVILDKENLDFLNYFFSKFPKYTIKMKATENETKKILEKIKDFNNKKENEKNNQPKNSSESKNPKSSQECIDQLLKNSEQFFAPLHSFRKWTITSSITLTTLTEIIFSQNLEYLKLEDLNLSDDKNYSPLLIQFFNQDDSKEFFKKIITNEKICLQICYEFLTIIGVLWQSLTEETLKVAKDWYNQNTSKNKKS
ncbi:hypothetical protein KAT08_01325 [Candidatus Babeliales bacterium]|nr:hypothetical protein [Candidatus Babeliales bacterium]